MAYDIHRIAGQFQVEGVIDGAAPYGNGHINDTFRVYWIRDGQSVPYILQRINHDVFKQPIPLMGNVVRVTELQREVLQMEGETDLDRRALRLVPTRDGQWFYQDDDGNVWRIYFFIERARSLEVIEEPDQAFEAAQAFGEFQKQVAGMSGERLFETIPNFHHTPKRFETFLQAVENDVCNRAQDVKAEIDFAMGFADMTGQLVQQFDAGHLPERITHNDTKVNNVMLDDVTGKGLCVIDLDTVMPGLMAYDFGEMVRTYTSPTEEDERDLSKVQMQMPMFQRLVEGFLSSAHSILTTEERQSLVLGGKMMTFENGIRFLTDHLSGDVYYKIHREGHNLDRCRTQFRLLSLIVEQEAAMQDWVMDWTPEE